MQNSKKLSWTSTICLMAGLGVAYSGGAMASTEGLNCSIGDANVWSSGFVLNNIEVTNNSGESIDEWEVEVHLGASDAAVTNYWNSTVSVEGNIATVNNKAYNGKLTNGQSTAFGFQGTYSGTWSEASCVVTSSSESEIEVPVDEVPEAEVPEVEVPAAEEPEVEEPEVEVPEAEEPEVEVPEAEEPEAEVPEVEVPEVEVPEVEVPEAEVPEVEVPEVDAPESSNLSCIEGKVDVWTGGVVVSNYGIKNEGDSTVSEWHVTLDFGTDVTITNSWNQDPVTAGNLVVISGSNLPTGGEVGFGFQGTYSGDNINNPPTCTISTTAVESGGTETEVITYQPVEGDDWLHTDGSKIVDKAGNEVWLTGANWFGFNTGSDMFDGLWAANLETAIKEMTERGINILRVPISTELMADWMNGVYPVPGSMNASVNPELDGLNSLEVFEYTLTLSQKYGLKILVDVHSASSNAAGHFEELWYDESVTTETFFDAWVWFAKRYKNDDTILAFDLENEPHGQAYNNPDSAIWDDSDDVNNWRAVAQELGERILAVHPEVLILVEGVETTPIEGKTYASKSKDDYYSNWWGGNLRGVRDYPIDLGNQLVYSPHDYGPSVFLQEWFYDGFDMDSLYKDVWYDNWAFINEDNIAPLLIGEWGGFMDGGDNEKWMLALRQFMIENHIHHTFWCFNANSGDTGGLVENDFVTWDEEKYELLEKALWQTDEGLYISLDHAVPLGSSAGTGVSVSDIYK